MYFDDNNIAPANRVILELATLQIFMLAFADDAVLISQNAQSL